MPKKLSDEDRALFRASVDAIKPLKKNIGRALTEKPDLTPPIEKKIESGAKSQRSLSSMYYEEVDVEACLSYRQPSLSQKCFTDLKNARKPWQCCLDLHGLRPDEAEEKILGFLSKVQEKGYQRVLIIHGKGGRSNKKAILKNLVNHWLKQLPEILAFHSALPRDGGNGALYILIKRTRID